MNSSYKVKFTENTKSVLCEIVVEKEDKDEALQEAKELYTEASKFCRLVMTKKYLE